MPIRQADGVHKQALERKVIQVSLVLHFSLNVNCDSRATYLFSL